MKKVGILALCSVLFSCVWLFLLIHLSEIEKGFEASEPMIAVVEKTEDDVLYERQIEALGEEIAFHAHRLSKKYDMPAEVVCALVQTESDGINGRVSSANCVGLTQVSGAAVEQYNRVNGTSWELMDCKDDVKVNLEVGLWYFNWCVRQVEGTKYKWQNAYLMFNVGYGYYKKFYYEWVNGRNPLNGKRYRALERFNGKLNAASKFFEIS